MGKPNHPKMSNGRNAILSCVWSRSSPPSRSDPGKPPCQGLPGRKSRSATPTRHALAGRSSVSSSIEGSSLLAVPPPLQPAPRTTKNPPCRRPGPPPVPITRRDEQALTNVGRTLPCDRRTPARSVLAYRQRRDASAHRLEHRTPPYVLPVDRGELRRSGIRTK